MYASKENARKAAVIVQQCLIDDGEHTNKNLEFLKEFIDKCERKLPSEAAYKAD